MKLQWIAFLLLNLFATTASHAYEFEEAFNNVYSSAVWGRNAEGRGHSGDGSTVQNTKLYRLFLEDFLSSHQIKTIVDYGCGDWEFSQLLNLHGIDYLGIDIVKSVVDYNEAKYGSSSVKFMHANGNEINLPEADLLICKDVLQHLPNSAIHAFITQLPKYKYCLIINDVDPISFTSSNPDTYASNLRFVDLTKPPFQVKGEKILTFTCGGTTKQVLLIRHLA